MEIKLIKRDKILSFVGKWALKLCSIVRRRNYECQQFRRLRFVFVCLFFFLLCTPTTPTTTLNCGRHKNEWFPFIRMQYSFVISPDLFHRPAIPFARIIKRRKPNGKCPPFARFYLLTCRVIHWRARAQSRDVPKCHLHFCACAGHGQPAFQWEAALACWDGPEALAKYFHKTRTERQMWFGSGFLYSSPAEQRIKRICFVWLGRTLCSRVWCSSMLKAPAGG